MNVFFDAPTPLNYFASLVQSDDGFPVLEAAISLGQDDYPDLDIQQVLGDVDQLVARLKRRVPADSASLQKLRLLNHFFFRELSFAGNVNHYYDADNSFIHAVLRTRKGIPITLAVLWLELAQALGLQAKGVGFPGHFMVKVSLPHGQVVMDPFTGQSLSREDLSERLEPIRRKTGLTGEFEVPLSLYLQAEPPRQIIARMLRNLKEIHRVQADWARLVCVSDRLVILLPENWGERRDRGLALAALGRTADAAGDLECYLSHAQDALDRDAIVARIKELRKTSN